MISTFNLLNHNQKFDFDFSLTFNFNYRQTLKSCFSNRFLYRTTNINYSSSSAVLDEVLHISIHQISILKTLLPIIQISSINQLQSTNQLIPKNKFDCFIEWSASSKILNNTIHELEWNTGFLMKSDKKSINVQLKD